MSHFVWYRGEWIEFDPKAPRPRSVAPMVVRDIDPYRCIATGDRIRSRRHHRDHLRAHRFIEIGNEYNRALDRGERTFGAAPDTTSGARKQAIAEAIAQVEAGHGRKSAGTEGDDL